MRCPDCNKFVSQEPGDVEVVSEDVDGDGLVTIEVRITQNCAACGTELKEATLTIERNFNDQAEEAHDAYTYGCDGESVDDDVDEAKVLAALFYWLCTDLTAADISDRVQDALDEFEVEHTFEVEASLDNAEWSKGTGRSCRRYFGVEGSIVVRCSCGADAEFSIDCNEQNDDTYVAASGMDECC